MGIPDGAHTHGSGGPSTVLLMILAAAVLGPALGAAVAALLHPLVIIGAVILGLAAVSVVAIAVAWRVRSTRPGPPRVVLRATAVPPWRSQALPGTPPAIERRPDIHLHFHGVNGEDVAAITRRQQEDQ